jgi:hypothetical protein
LEQQFGHLSVFHMVLSGSPSGTTCSLGTLGARAPNQEVGMHEPLSSAPLVPTNKGRSG